MSVEQDSVDSDAQVDSGRVEYRQAPWKLSATSPWTLLIVGAAAAGIALRFISVSPLWLDEVLSVRIATGDLAITEALRRDGHPALYYLLLGWWIDLFGGGEVSVRALSGIFSVAAVPFVVLCARSYGPGVAATAVVLAATSPYMMRYGTEARMYSLVVLEVVFGWWALQRALERPAPGRLFVVAFTAAALAHTHYWSVFVIVAVLVLLVYSAATGKQRKGAVVRVGAAVVAGCATLVVWLPVLAEQLTRTGTPWAGRARPTEILIETAQAFGGSSRFDGETLGISVLVIAAVGMFAVSDGERNELRLNFATMNRHMALGAVVVGALVLAAVVSLATSGAFEARYAAIVFPFVIVLAARGVISFPAPAVPVILCLLALFGVSVGAYEAIHDRSQGREIAEAIAAAASQDDVVAFCPDQIGPATMHYLDGDVLTLAYPRGNGTTIDWRDYRATIAGQHPDVFALDLLDLAGTGDVWLVIARNYPGFGDRCDLIMQHLRRTRTDQTFVASRQLFESMMLVRYSPS